jgi:WD40 repeat protein
VTGGGCLPDCDTSIRIGDAESGRELLVCQGHACGNYSLAFDPRTGILASASEDYSVILWNLELGDAIFLAGADDIVKSHVAFATYRPLAAIAEGKAYEDCASVFVIDLASGEEVFRRKLDADQAATAMAFNADGSRVTFAEREFLYGDCSTIQCWDVPSNSVLWRQEYRAGTIHDLEYLADNRGLAATVMETSEDDDDFAGVYLLDERGEVVAKRMEKSTELTIARCPTEPVIAALFSGGPLQLLTMPELITEKRIEEARKPGDRRVSSLRFSTDGKRVFLGDSSGGISIFER